jgi:hypothetical protein
MEYEWFCFSSISTAEYAGLVYNICVFVCMCVLCVCVCVCVCVSAKRIMVWTDAVYIKTRKKHVNDTNLKTEIMCQLL